MSSAVCQRRFPRAATYHLTTLSSVTGYDRQQARISQLGAGGCMVSVTQRIGVGRILQLKLQLGQTELTAICKALYEYEDRSGFIHVGMEFVCLSDGERESLTRYVAGQLAPSKEPPRASALSH